MGVMRHVRERRGGGGDRTRAGEGEGGGAGLCGVPVLGIRPGGTLIDENSAGTFFLYRAA